MDKQQNENFKKRFIENRLAFILPRTLPARAQNDFCFFTISGNGLYIKSGSPSLIYTFDNCVKLNKDMTHYVIGQIFLDTHDRLMLAIWPAKIRWEVDKDPPMHQEVLMENVENIVFHFYAPIEKRDSRDKENVAKVPSEIRTGDWQTEWKKEYNAPPAIIRLDITLKKSEEPGKNGEEVEEKMTFAFPIPNAYQKIIYE